MKSFNYRAIQTARSEDTCEYLFKSGGPYWHLCTPGQSTEILFTEPKDFIFCINLIAIIQRETGVKILTFEVMNNHLHFILECPRSVAETFFALLKRRLKRRFRLEGRFVDLQEFECTLIEIDNLRSLRNEIVYVNRNGYLANKVHTPFSYYWGAGRLFFNSAQETGVPFASLSKNEQESILRSRTNTIYGELMIDEEMFCIESFCDIKKAMSLFRNGNHYFFLLSKNYEAYSGIAQRLGDKIVLSDDEIFSVICLTTKKEYSVTSPSMLPPKAKLEIARKMRTEYNASEKQLRRILKLDPGVVKELFGR
ncbi:MAG: transposase [Bacteroidales bacterium]|nr:transposase [Bacteroidales bacterium]